MTSKTDFLILSVGRAISAVVALASIRIATAFLVPEQFGMLALLNAVLTFCGLFLINPVLQHINLHTHLWWDENSLMSRLRGYNKYLVLVSLVGAAAVLISNLSSSNEMLAYMTLATFLMVFAYSWNQTLIPMLNMLGFRVESVLMTILTLIPGLICSSGLSVVWPSATSWFLGQAIGMTVGAIGARYIFKLRVKNRHQPNVNFDLIDKNQLINYCIPFAIAMGLLWFQLSGYRFLIEGYWGLINLGILAVGFQISAGIWSLIESLAMQVLYPPFYRRISGSEDQNILKSAYSDLLNTIMPIYFILAGLIMLSAQFILNIFVAEQYHQAVDFFLFGASIELCRVLSNLFSNAAHAKRKAMLLFLPYLTGAAATFFLVFIFGRVHAPMEWAASGILIGGICTLLVMSAVMFKQISFVIDYKRLLFSISIFFLLVAMRQFLPNVSNLYQNLYILLGIGMFGVVLIYGLLKSNPSALRLIDTKLRQN